MYVLMFCTFTSTSICLCLYRNVASIWHDMTKVAVATFTRNADKPSQPEFILALSSSVTDLLSWSEKDMRVHPQGDIHTQLVDFPNFLPIVALCLLLHYHD